MGKVRRSHEAARKIGNPRPSIAECKWHFSTESENQDRSSIGKNKPDEMLFSCPEEGCVKGYSRFANLQTHLDTGKHQMMIEQETLYDRAKREYSSKLTEGCSRIPSVQVTVQSNS